MFTVITKYGHSIRTTTKRGRKKEGLFRGSIA